MSDLTDERIADLIDHARDCRECDPYERPMLELKQLRAARAADAERVRSVVREACDFVADELLTVAERDAIANRAAEQLAGAVVGLSAEERTVILRMRGRIGEMVPMGNGDEVALGRLLDRLLA